MIENVCQNSMEWGYSIMEHTDDEESDFEAFEGSLAPKKNCFACQKTKVRTDMGHSVKSVFGCLGDDCSQSDTEEEDWTPVREALQAGMVDFARYLVDAGCDLSRERYLFASPVASFSRTAPSAFSAALNDEDDSEDDDDDDDGIPDVVKDNPELFQWLRHRARNARSLVQLSLEAVRGVFRHGDPPFALMLALPLPEKMIARLFYRDTL